MGNCQVRSCCLVSTRLKDLAGVKLAAHWLLCLVLNVCPLTFRYVRREKEIAETKCDLAVSESARFKQKCEQLSQQLQKAEETLRQERGRTQVMREGH